MRFIENVHIYILLSFVDLSIHKLDARVIRENSFNFGEFEKYENKYPAFYIC